MKIYTKTGDSGTTSLLGGTRVSKADQRIEAYGTVDELNSFLGLLRTETKDHEVFLSSIQNKLFNIGSTLATERKVNFDVPRITEEDIMALEAEMDRMDAELPALKSFVLSGGSRSNALAHVCRSICRRAERRVIVLEEDHDLVVKYLNRLSDYFFMLSRYLLYAEGKSDVLWQKD